MQHNNAKVGDWEKHTKGFGSKLLSKFGFKGRLGAKEDGISRAVEVVVRPTNQGLGFGDNVEASALPANKRIEAEWRGIEYKEEDEPQAKRQKSGVEKLADSQMWKKDKGKAAKEKKKTKDAINAAKDVDIFIAKQLEKVRAKERNKQVIVDMRREETRIVTDATEINVDLDRRKVEAKLGQEYLYNINVVAEMAEMELTNDARELSKLAARRQAYEAERAQHRQQVERNQQRLRALRGMHDILNRFKEGAASLSGMQSNGREAEVRSAGGLDLSMLSFTIEEVLLIVKELYERFETEFMAFGLISLLPMYLNAAIPEIVRGWEPLRSSGLLSQLHVEWMRIVEYFLEKGNLSIAKQAEEILHIKVRDLVIPLVRRAVANDWIVLRDGSGSSKGSGRCVELVQHLQLVLSARAFDDVADTIILPKLSEAVRDWKPVSAYSTKTDAGGQLAHLWLHPWLPLLRGKLSALYPDLRRKMHHCLSGSWSPLAEAAAYSALSRVSGDSGVSSATPTLTPNPHLVSSHSVKMLRAWKGVFDQASFENLLVRSVVPKLVTMMRDSVIIAPPAVDDDGTFAWLMQWAELLPPMHLECLLLGEFFPRWLEVFSTWLLSRSHQPHPQDPQGQRQRQLQPSDLFAAAEWYKRWRALFPAALFEEAQQGSSNWLLLPLSLALDVMEAALPSPEKHATAPAPEAVVRSLEAVLREMRVGYSTLLERRAAEARAQRRLSELEQQSKVAESKRRNGQSATVSFKEVVQAFAEQHSVEFAPKLGKYHEGKQVWQFGTQLCFIDSQVVFVQEGAGAGLGKGQWSPIDLEDLLQRVRNKTTS